MGKGVHTGEEAKIGAGVGVEVNDWFEGAIVSVSNGLVIGGVSGFAV